MFNLEQAVTAWRGRMLAAGIKSPVPLEELENHLRDDVEHQLQLGSDAQQAFEAAVLRIGGAGALQCEFTKVGATWQVLRRKLVWALIGAAFLSCWITFGRAPAVDSFMAFCSPDSLSPRSLISSTLSFPTKLPSAASLQDFFVRFYCRNSMVKNS